MNEEELQRFHAFANATPQFQALVSKVGSPSELLHLCQSRGFALSFNDLLIGARDWPDPFWPWSGQSKQFFRFFFHEGRLPDPSELSAL